MTISVSVTGTAISASIAETDIGAVVTPTPISVQVSGYGSHATLNELAYASSGHTGFQQSIEDARLELPMGEISYFNTTGTNAVIVAQSNGTTNMVKAAPATSLMNDGTFDNGGSNNGRLRYTGTITRMFHVACTISISPVAANDVFVFGVAKNGVVLPQSKVIMQSVNASQPRSTAMHVMVSLATNEYLEMFVGNITDTDDCKILSLNLFAMGM